LEADRDVIESEGEWRSHCQNSLCSISTVSNVPPPTGQSPNREFCKKSKSRTPSKEKNTREKEEHRRREEEKEEGEGEDKNKKMRVSIHEFHRYVSRRGKSSVLKTKVRGKNKSEKQKKKSSSSPFPLFLFSSFLSISSFSRLLFLSPLKHGKSN
jgi:hypothetical protein